MSVVVLNVLTVADPAAGEVLERRFAGRAGSVEQAPGFEGFALLRPVAGTQQYAVWTRWRARKDFEAWQASQDFGRGHAQARTDGDGRPTVVTANEVWVFEATQEVLPPA